MKRGKKTYFKRKQEQQRFGKDGKKTLFRANKPYGIKPDPFPRSLHTRLKYTDFKTLTAGITADTSGTEQVYNLNSIWDPDFSGVGLTVVGHTPLKDIYSRYIVMGCKVEIVFTDPLSDGVICYASLNQSESTIGKGSAQIMGQMLTYSSVINNTGSQKKRFNFYVQPWSLVGLSKLEWLANKSTHSSLMSANPTQTCVLRVNCSGKAGSETVACRIKLIYYTELFERKQLAASAIV